MGERQPTARCACGRREPRALNFRLLSKAKAARAVRELLSAESLNFCACTSGEGTPGEGTELRILLRLQTAVSPGCCISASPSPPFAPGLPWEARRTRGLAAGRMCDSLDSAHAWLESPRSWVVRCEGR